MISNPPPIRPFQAPRLLLLLLVLGLALPVTRGQDIFLSASPTPALPTIVPGGHVIRDIQYVPGGTPRQRLDLYLPNHPPAPGAPCPLVAYIHGGGWHAGTKDGCPARQFLPLGYAAASIEYRLSQDAPFPAQIQDCKAAIRWLRANAKQYNIDPNHIGVWGASAGGHLVALLGVTGTDRQFDTGPNLDQSSAVQCVVDFFGPADFLHGHLDPAKLDTPQSAVYQLLGGPLSTHQALARSASPVYYISKDSAPFLILHGDHDTTVPLEQSQELNADLQKAGVESTLKVVANAGHSGPAFNAPKNRKLVLDFVNRHLKPAAGG